MLAELIQYTEFCPACVRASEAGAARSPSSVMTPAAMPLWTVRMCEIIQILGAGRRVAVPSYAELDGPAAAEVATHLQAANADVKNAHQAVPPRFRHRGLVLRRPPTALRALLLGRPVRLAGTLYGLYGEDTHIDRIFGLLDDLEALESVSRKSL
jgi:4-hydroxyphenylacetate 3-monooxygenase